MQPYTMRGQRSSSAREWHQVASRPVFLIVAIIAILAAPCAEASNLAVDPQNPATLYHASERGVFKSTDGGATWSPRNAGFPRQERSLYVNVLAMDPTKPKILYAGTQDLGLFKTTLYVGTGDRGVFKSIDGGASWSLADRGMTNKVVQTLAIDPRMSSTIYALTAAGNAAAVFRSVDAGGNW